jgi:DNA invertase Pin-like site-specific DNA recombinase
MAGNQSDVRVRLSVARGPGPGRAQRHVDSAQVAELRTQGLSWRQIAKRLGVGYGTARRAYQRRAKIEPKVILEISGSK